MMSYGWVFLNGGRSAAYSECTVHGSCAPSYHLVDVRSGKRIAEYQSELPICGEVYCAPGEESQATQPVSNKKPPAWVEEMGNILEKEYERAQHHNR
jgi:hypothetical protein